MAIEVFYSYAREDEDLRNELEKSLSLLRRQGLIVGWHDRRVGAGDQWSKEIDAHARSADIILLLISADFLASDYCWSVEMTLALERHAKREAIVIPVILRAVDWSAAPFGQLQALPRDAKAVTSWANRDEALADIARGIREIVQSSQSGDPALPNSDHSQLLNIVPKSRVLDAAIPNSIVKNLATELLILIRLPESSGLAGLLLTDEESETRPEDVRSKPFGISFARGPDGRFQPHKVTVKLTSPDFVPPEQAKNLFVEPYTDSDVCPFMLTPIRTGRLRVLIELQWDDALRGHRRLLTECVSEATQSSKVAEMNVVQMPLPIATRSRRTPSVVVSNPMPRGDATGTMRVALATEPSLTWGPPNRRNKSFMRTLGALVSVFACIAAVLTMRLRQRALPSPAQIIRVEPQGSNSPGVRRVTHTREVTSGSVEFGCNQTLQVETPTVLFGSNPKDIDAQPSWANTDNVKTRNQGVANIGGSGDHPIKGVKGAGTITGLDTVAALGLKNCPGGGHGELRLRVSWTDEEEPDLRPIPTGPPIR